MSQTDGIGADQQGTSVPGGTGVGQPTVDTLAESAVRGAAWMGLQKWGINLASFGVFVVLGRLLAPRDFGLLAAANVLILLLRIVVDAGISRALVQRRDLAAEHIDTAFWTTVAIGVTLALVTAAGAPLMALVFAQPALTNVVRVLGIDFIIAAMDATQSALIDREMAFRTQALRVLAGTIVSSVAAIALALDGGGVWALVLQTLSFEAVNVTLLWSIVSWRPRVRFSVRHLRELLSFGGRYSVIRLLWYLSSNADNFLVGVVLGPAALGFYTVGYRVLVVLDEVLVSTVNQVALPMFSRLQQDRERLYLAFYQAVKLSAAVSWPLFVGLALVAGRLVPLLFGAKWGPSVPVMQALAVVGILSSVTSFTHNLVLALGRVRDEMRWSALLTAAQLSAFSGSVDFGIVAVAIGLAAVTVLSWPVRLVMVTRWTGIKLRTYFGQLVGPAMAVAVMGGAVALTGWLLDTALPAGAILGIQIVVGGVVYSLALVSLDRGAAGQLLSALRSLRA